MSPDERAAIGRRWRDEGARFARELNSFLERLGRVGSEQVGPEPQDTRGDLAEIVLEAVREANESRELAQLREQLPPAFFPFLGRSSWVMRGGVCGRLIGTVRSGGTISSAPR